MHIKTAKRWFNWHKWTSLVCTIFLLMLSVTGLPLIFHEEINDFLDYQKEAIVPPNTVKLSLDSLAGIAEAQYPGKKVRYAFWEDTEPNKLMFDVSESPVAPPEKSNYIILNEYTGELLGSIPTDGLMNDILKLHTDMFAGIPGKLFLGLMGILFVIALISGVVLYGPIMKNFYFGIVRKHKSKRLRWLDTHNLLGIVLLAWMMVVGVTGIINTMSDVVLALWQRGQLKEMTAPYQDMKPIMGSMASLDTALAVANRTVPDMMKASLIAFPGTPLSSKHHYAVFMRGDKPLNSRLLMPVLVDAQTGKLTDARAMPWYVSALFLSQPLHFGDYGGLPLKILWAVFDLLTIMVLITGLYLWIARRKSGKQKWERINTQQTSKHEKIPA